uniref:Uncharacterized protein MANES_11G156700 n=2 Tax=Rhizophora mucronata TaxID=61149 RepID=A0A2P2KNW4_RHIMU
MEFWGVEVKGGEALKVKPKEDSLIHISQAALGESKKDKSNEPVPLFVKFENKKLVLGTLISDNIPQLSFDLVFEKEFELSHNWKHGSIYFCGYQTPLPDEDDEFSDFDEPEDELPLVMAENGKVEPKVENAKPPTAKAIAGKPEASVKPKAKLAEPSKDNKFEDESDDSDESDEDESDDGEGSEDEDGESEEGMSIDEDDDDDDDEDDASDDDETPKKAESGKKRPNDSATKTPVSSKKAKVGTPQKTDGKKGGHTATPHPAKNAGKAAANAKPQTPKSGGQISCKSCDRSFGSDAALQSHTKAKHSGK